jgi:outer membrane receptor protein involved in Fe transport
VAFGQQPQGSVSVTIYDAKTGRPIPQITVEIVGQSQTALTDIDGNARLQTAPGQYTLSLKGEKYSPATITEVIVEAGQAVEVAGVMALATDVTTVEVTESVNAVASTSQSMLTERKLRDVMSDGISREEISASTASDAAGALEKVTGVSVVNDAFVYVRGLGERYSAANLNGAMLPTTEPEKRVVPLDLFPSGLIDRINIAKTYSPDMPGEFAGGLIQIETIQFPTKPTLIVKQTIGFNTRTQGNRWGTYPGGGRDWTGLDDGSRDLPSQIPGSLIDNRVAPEERQRLGRLFDNNYDPEFEESVRPTQTYSVVAGNTFGKLGIVGAFTYANTLQTNNEFRNFYRLSGETPVQFVTYDYNGYGNGVRLGGILNLSYQLNSTSRISLKNFLSRDTDRETRTFEGYESDSDNFVRYNRLRWIERSILSNSLQGDHVLTFAKNSILDWRFTFSNSKRDEPDLRETGYILDGDPRTSTPEARFAVTSNSPIRFFSNLDEKIYEPGVNWSMPFYNSKLSGIFKFGGLATLRRREFGARRFSYRSVGLPSNLLFDTANNIMIPENFGPTRALDFIEYTRSTDAYTGDMDVYAGYGMVDLSFGKWRLTGGVRLENAEIGVVTTSPIAVDAPVVANLKNTDWLPGVNATYQLTQTQNLRFGVSRTVNRPDFRELSPFDFQEVVGFYTTLGNPNLQRAAIDNYDARWEWFPGPNELVAASFFYKKFTDPIERYIEATVSLRQTFQNAQGAKNYGFEIEARKNLGNVLGNSFRDFSVFSNFTFVDSDIQLDPALLGVVTSRTRPLTGQSRYLVNIAADWSKPAWRSNARLYFNSVSRRLIDVGSFGLPDIYEERNNILDAVYQFDILEGGRLSLRVSAQNLTDNTYRTTQADLPFRTFQLGRTFSVGTTWTIF